MTNRTQKKGQKSGDAKMSSIELKLDLPDSLAREAKANGLLTPEAIASLLRAEIRRRRVDKLFDVAYRLAALDAPLSEAEVEAEIAAARQAYRSSDANLNVQQGHK